MNIEFKPSLFIRNCHIQTIIPSQFRFIKIQKSRSESIDADLGDQLDLDWYHNGKKKLLILSHGLEGDSERHYIKGMIKAVKESYDCLAWNYRSCGKNFTQSKQLYHNGKIDDLERVIIHIISLGTYDEIHLVGFSMGANLNMLYLGKKRVPNQVKSCLSVSAALDLKSSAIQLEKSINYFYMKRFLKKLQHKLIKKNEQYPNLVDLTAFSKIRSFREFDDRYTAPLHGFDGVEDYWEKCSSLFHLKDITIPVLILSSLDDPFLGKSCFPTKAEINNPLIESYYTNFGGHVGFFQGFNMKESFAEKLAKEFLNVP